MLQLSSCFDFTWSSSAIGSDSAGQEILPASIGRSAASVGQGEFFHVVTRSAQRALIGRRSQSVNFSRSHDAADAGQLTLRWSNLRESATSKLSPCNLHSSMLWTSRKLNVPSFH